MFVGVTIGGFLFFVGLDDEKTIYQTCGVVSVSGRLLEAWRADESVIGVVLSTASVAMVLLLCCTRYPMPRLIASVDVFGASRVRRRVRCELRVLAPMIKAKLSAPP